ncbi:hypothetical protein ACHAXA_004449 [Cyclostephanos tholiformis]|uniref:Immune mapped protein 2 N-terminal domain-containing protein n=1 Tax=Cyclostephanos tholiformis TaxID=382380 RepID=A0ABD3SBQ8_9STRA
MSNSPSLLAVPESASSQRCYLVISTETRSLIEHYSEDNVEKFLAYWTAPADKKIPKFKFTQNWGKSEIVNFAKGDTFGRNAYFSGLCQWLKKAKTFDATIAFCDQYPGWECDLYFYLMEPVDGIQMVRVEYGEVFSVSWLSAWLFFHGGRTSFIKISELKLESNNGYPRGVSLAIQANSMSRLARLFQRVRFPSHLEDL